MVAQTKEGWAIPVNIKFKTELINQEDCGLIAHIEKIPFEYNYIVV